jgi:hypothetical protein
MTSPLVPCRACDRHVRSTEPACPFCGAAIENVVVARARPRANTSRAAILAFSSSVLLACGGEGGGETATDDHASAGDEREGSRPDPTDGPRTGPQPRPRDEGGVVALYGAPSD